jgi:hypothetical protein
MKPLNPSTAAIQKNLLQLAAALTVTHTKDTHRDPRCQAREIRNNSQVTK